MRRHKLSASAAAAEAAAPGAGEAAEDGVTAQSLINTLFVILLCLAGGKVLVGLMAGTGFILPEFVFCLLLGVVIRNATSLTSVFRISEASVDALGTVALSLFLVMALMTMRLLDLVNLAGPLLVILAAQTVATALYAAVVTFRVMGRNYDAAIMAAGQIGFGMSSTACALAIMRSVTERHGGHSLQKGSWPDTPFVILFKTVSYSGLCLQSNLCIPVPDVVLKSIGSLT